jgi:AcrR family transcriptional regulator
MNTAVQVADEKKARILAVARELIQETGDFDLPMRALAARAQVSLRTPYEYFRSKAGVIGALLVEDLEHFRETVNHYSSVDEVEHIFDRVRWGIDFYALNEPFYRALFRATQAYAPDRELEPARQPLLSFQKLCGHAGKAGLLRQGIDPGHLGETLTDIFASGVRTWAMEHFDLQLASVKIRFGFATVLAGVVSDPQIERMRAHIQEFQQAIDSFDSRLTTIAPTVSDTNSAQGAEVGP